MPGTVVVLFDNPDGRSLVQDVCKEAGILFAEFQELVQAEIEQTGKQRKKGLWDDFDDILDRILDDD